MSQRAEGWVAVQDTYEDPGYSGGNMERPGLKRLLADIKAGKVDMIVVYKIDRLSRSLADFAKMVEVFDKHQVSFSSVTQQINSATSTGRLMLNMLLSFAQFEREVMRAWDAGMNPDLELDQFLGQPCWIGLDLASKTDIAALVMLFQHPDTPDAFVVFGKYYLPEDTVQAAGNSQYQGWSHTGLLSVTPGNVIDFSWIEADLLEIASKYSVEAVAFDPFQATQLSTRMLAEGLPMIEVRPTVLNFSEPMKTLEALVLQKKLVHDGDPVLAWMASNVVAHTDVKDNIYPRKERAENKIDGIVALIMALSRALKPGESLVLDSDYELMVL